MSKKHNEDKRTDQVRARQGQLSQEHCPTTVFGIIPHLLMELSAQLTSWRKMMSQTANSWMRTDEQTSLAISQT